LENAVGVYMYAVGYRWQNCSNWSKYFSEITSVNLNTSVSFWKRLH